jgi:hypothetical protein
MAKNVIHRRPGGDGPLLERNRQQRRHRERVRMVQRQMGLVWQITPRALLDATTDPDRAAAKRAFEAMMKMKKLDIAAIEAARRPTQTEALTQPACRSPTS